MSLRFEVLIETAPYIVLFGTIVRDLTLDVQDLRVQVDFYLPKNVRNTISVHNIDSGADYGYQVTRINDFELQIDILTADLAEI